MCKCASRTKSHTKRRTTNKSIKKKRKYKRKPKVKYDKTKGNKGADACKANKTRSTVSRRRTNRSNEFVIKSTGYNTDITRKTLLNSRQTQKQSVSSIFCKGDHLTNFGAADMILMLEKEPAMRALKKASGAEIEELNKMAMITMFNNAMCKMGYVTPDSVMVTSGRY